VKVPRVGNARRNKGARSTRTPEKLPEWSGQPGPYPSLTRGIPLLDRGWKSPAETHDRASQPGHKECAKGLPPALRVTGSIAKPTIWPKNPAILHQGAMFPRPEDCHCSFFFGYRSGSIWQSNFFLLGTLLSRSVDRIAPHGWPPQSDRHQESPSDPYYGVGARRIHTKSTIDQLTFLLRMPCGLELRNSVEEGKKTPSS